MTIIEIKHTREIPCDSWHGYVAEPAVENAVKQHLERYGTLPDNVYFKRMPSGRMSVFIPTGECEGR